jgi:hypothetical protein
MPEENTNTEKLIMLGEQILAELQLLTSSTKAAALTRFQSDILITEQQRKIYKAIDGEQDSQALATTTGASLRAVQLLIKELQEKDLIDVTRKSKSNIPMKSTAKIATYYAKMDITNTGGKEIG